MGILIMLILPNHEHGMCFHLFVSSSIYFFVSYNFPCTGLLYPRLDLFLGTLFFLKQLQIGLFSEFPFLLVHYWHIKMQLISGY